MSGIQRRTVFFGEGSDGLTRFSPWARVITGLGVCFEPRPIGPGGERDGLSDFDQADMVNRIDGVENYNPMNVTMGDNTTGGQVCPLGIVTSY